ncbi:MAG: GGDEF domain-containing protein [Treponema sp.]|nr:GGDEF domain-containing protein [Treponema sp.]
MKTIAVILPNLVMEYSYDFLRGISSFAKDKDVKFIIAQTKIPHSTICIFDYQYWTSMEFLRSDEIDAIIVATGIYCGTPELEYDNFINAVKKFSSKPVVSISIELELEGDNFHSVLIDCKKSFRQTVEHLKNVHNCKKIGFLSANSTNSREAFERFDAFKEALADNGLEFDPELVWDGGFTDFNAEKVFGEKIKSRKDVTFDAIVSANDMMAIGCMRVLEKIGIRVPGELKIIGFDDSPVATLSKPKLSTVNQQIMNQGYEAAEMAWDLVCDVSVPKVHYTQLSAKYRQTCGCVSMTNQLCEYKDFRGVTCGEVDRNSTNLFKFVNDLDYKNNLITIMDMLRGANTLRQLFYNLKFIIREIDFSSISLNFYREPIFLDSTDDITLPKEMEMYMFSDRDNDKDYFRPGIFFNPREKLFATNEFSDNPGVYVFQPIFCGESNYGFMICRVTGTEFANYNVYLKIISTAVSQAFEYTERINETEQLENENAKLMQETKLDELTGIRNRRGFYEAGQQTLDIMQEKSSAGIVFFMDVDNLKTINDTYGHDMGDRALRLQAKVLKEIFGASDVIGRIGGDEFGVVALGLLKEQVEEVKQKIEEADKKAAEKEGLPFTLSISVGAADLEASTVLKKLLTVADKEMYIEKRKKHGKQ